MIGYQLCAVLFSILFAALQIEPVTYMRDFGASVYEEKKFHILSAAGKILFSGGLYFFHKDWVMIIVTLLIQWIVFDIALNVFTGKGWDYTGRTAMLDRFLFKVGGNKAGIIKDLICLAIIIFLNIKIIPLHL